ncbi:MAG TPA: hypothetical protein VHV54_08450 [Candidatus Binatia bacterium]|nr:hypothetical protein [Candidatus Binatia bacterium]
MSILLLNFLADAWLGSKRASGYSRFSNESSKRFDKRAATFVGWRRFTLGPVTEERADTAVP